MKKKKKIEIYIIFLNIFMSEWFIYAQNMTCLFTFKHFSKLTPHSPLRLTHLLKHILTSRLLKCFLLDICSAILKTHLHTPLWVQVLCQYFFFFVYVNICNLCNRFGKITKCSDGCFESTDLSLCKINCMNKNITNMSQLKMLRRELFLYL